MNISKLKIWIISIAFLAQSAAVFAVEASTSTYKILFLGDSLTEGLGVPRMAAYPQLVEKKFHAAGMKNIQVINSGVSGSTTASLVSRTAWVLKAKPQMVFLALGANDGLRGLSVDEMGKNLEQAIHLFREKGIEVVLAGMKMPPNYGGAYAKSFEGVFQNLSKSKNVKFFPFLLEGVAANKAMNQADGIHPNEKGYQVMAEKIFLFLKPQVEKEMKSRKANF